MSFRDPLWLLVLLLIPIGLGLARLLRRRARRYAVRFPAAVSVQQALTASVGWPRWLTVLAAALALAAAALTLARPQLNDRVPIGNASLMLVLDHSGSMAATDVAPTRISAAIRAANQFIAELPPDIRVGAVGFGTTPDAVQQPVPSHAAARNLIDAQVAGGGTDTGPALALALSLLHGGQRHHPPSAIVLLSDGAANLGESPVTVAQVARRDRIPIYTVALGTPSGVLDEGPLYPPVPVPPDPQLMAQIASASGGRTFDAQSTDQLSSIYQALGRQLSTVPRKREITAEVALVAALLAVIALLASMRTATRLA